MLPKERIKAMRENLIDHGVGHEQGIEVVDVRLQFIVETAIAKAVEYFFTWLDGLIRQDNLLNLVVGLHQNIYVELVEDFEIGQQVLKLE